MESESREKLEEKLIRSPVTGHKSQVDPTAGLEEPALLYFDEGEGRVYVGNGRWITRFIEHDEGTLMLLEALQLKGVLGPEMEVLDLGTAEAPIPVAIAEQVQSVTGVEKNPSSVTWAKHNVKKNQLSNVEIIEGDFFHPQVKKNQYNRIVGNLPVLPIPKQQKVLTPAERPEMDGGLGGREVLERVIREGHSLLKARGAFILVHPHFIDLEKTRDLVGKLGLQMEILLERDFPLIPDERGRQNLLLKWRETIEEAHGIPYLVKDRIPYFRIQVLKIARPSLATGLEEGYAALWTDPSQHDPNRFGYVGHAVQVDNELGGFFAGSFLEHAYQMLSAEPLFVSTSILSVDADENLYVTESYSPVMLILEEVPEENLLWIAPMEITAEIGTSPHLSQVAYSHQLRLSGFGQPRPSPEEFLDWAKRRGGYSEVVVEGKGLAGKSFKVGGVLINKNHFKFRTIEPNLDGMRNWAEQKGLPFIVLEEYAHPAPAPVESSAERVASSADEITAWLVRLGIEFDGGQIERDLNDLVQLSHERGIQIPGVFEIASQRVEDQMWDRFFPRFHREKPWNPLDRPLDEQWTFIQSEWPASGSQSPAFVPVLETVDTEQSGHALRELFAQDIGDRGFYVVQRDRRFSIMDPVHLWELELPAEVVSPADPSLELEFYGAGRLKDLFDQATQIRRIRWTVNTETQTTGLEENVYVHPPVRVANSLHALLSPKVAFQLIRFYEVTENQITIRVTKIDPDRDPRGRHSVQPRSVVDVMSLGLRPGLQMEVEARGPYSGAILEQVTEFVVTLINSQNLKLYNKMAQNIDVSADRDEMDAALERFVREAEEGLEAIRQAIVGSEDASTGLEEGKVGEGQIANREWPEDQVTKSPSHQVTSSTSLVPIARATSDEQQATEFRIGLEEVSLGRFMADYGAELTADQRGGISPQASTVLVTDPISGQINVYAEGAGLTAGLEQLFRKKLPPGVPLAVYQVPLEDPEQQYKQPGVVVEDKALTDPVSNPLNFPVLEVWLADVDLLDLNDVLMLALRGYQDPTVKLLNVMIFKDSKGRARLALFV